MTHKFSVEKIKQSNSSTAPLVSVIIPAYNCKDFIVKALESILQQDYSNLEILVSDDCSTDNTKTIIDSYSDSRIKVFHNEKNKGNLITTNKLFKKATGTFVTFQDADDWSHPKRIGEQVKLLLNNPSVDICSTGFARVKQNGKLLFNVIPALSHDEVMDEIKEEQHPRMCYASILTYRKTIKQAGGIYRPYFKGIGGADIDFFYRLINNQTIRNTDQIRYFYRTTEQSITNNINLKQYYPLVVGPQLSFFLRLQRLHNGEDALQTNNFAELECIQVSIKNKYNQSIHQAYTSIATRWASFQQYGNLVAITRDYISFHPLSLTTYVNISIAFVRLFLGEEKYKRMSSKMSFIKKYITK